MPRSRKLLYIGTHRFVAALDPQTGEEQWRTKLPHTGSGVVTIVVKGRQQFVGHSGHAYCLDKRTGEILWKNDLPRMGYHAVLLAMEGAEGATSGPGAAAAQVEQRRRAAAASTGFSG